MLKTQFYINLKNSEPKYSHSHIFRSVMWNSRLLLLFLAFIIIKCLILLCQIPLAVLVPMKV